MQPDRQLRLPDETLERTGMGDVGKPWLVEAGRSATSQAGKESSGSVQTGHVGRNDACRSGSGARYERCCAAA